MTLRAHYRARWFAEQLHTHAAEKTSGDLDPSTFLPISLATTERNLKSSMIGMWQTSLGLPPCWLHPHVIKSLEAFLWTLVAPGHGLEEAKTSAQHSGLFMDWRLRFEHPKNELHTGNVHECAGILCIIEIDSTLLFMNGHAIEKLMR